jgi:hypothetical protein
VRPGKPYPATFRLASVEPPGIEPGFPVCRTGVVPLDHGPVSGPPGSRTPGTAAKRWSPGCKPSVLPLNEQPIYFKRSVRESNRAPCGAWSPLLTTEVCCRNTYRPSSDPGWNRTITLLGVIQASSPLDHGIMSVTEAGVEPAQPEGGWVTATGARQCPADAYSSSTGGSRTHSIPGSKSGWSASCLRSRSSPGRTRTAVHLLVREPPSPLGHRAVFVVSGPTGNCTRIASVRSWCLPVGSWARQSGRRGTRTPKRTLPPAAFKAASSSGWMPSVCKLRGLESNQHQGARERLVLPLDDPASFVPWRHVCPRASSGKRCRTATPPEKRC